MIGVVAINLEAYPDVVESDMILTMISILGDSSTGVSGCLDSTIYISAEVFREVVRLNYAEIRTTEARTNTVVGLEVFKLNTGLRVYVKTQSLGKQSDSRVVTILSC